SGHLDQRRILYLDLYSGHPQLAVNDNYFRIEPPPHLQQSWTGNVYGDSSIHNVTLWDSEKQKVFSKRISSLSFEQGIVLNKSLTISSNTSDEHGLFLVNNSNAGFNIRGE